MINPLQISKRNSVVIFDVEEEISETSQALEEDMSVQAQTLEENMPTHAQVLQKEISVTTQALEEDMSDQAQTLEENKSALTLALEEEMTTHAQALQEVISRGEISGIVISCRECNSLNETVALCLVRRVFDLLFLLVSKTKGGWWHPKVWLKNRKENQELALLVQSLSAERSTEDLNRFLARNHESIKNQISRFIEFEQTDLFLFVVSDFQIIRAEEQPIVGSVLHGLFKGTPAYFRILTLGRPTLFRKNNHEETGIQLNHDYVEIVWKNTPN